jgi:hypothetical protein
MAIDKDFVVRNGLQVNEDLLFADDANDRIGIGTTTPASKLVVIGDAEVSQNLSVGTTITAQRQNITGIMTAQEGYDIGVGGTVITASVKDKKVGINSTNPVYTLDLYGPVSTGTTAVYVYGDVEITGDFKATSLSGQISAGGTVGFTNVTVDKNLVANDAEVFTKFSVEDFGGTQFRFLTAGDPAGIGFTENTNNPSIYLIRGKHYKFFVDSAGFPFYIKSQPTADLNNIYQNGVVSNGAQVGIVTFMVPFDAPNKLYYQASNTAGMGGTIYLNNDQITNEVGILTVTENLVVTGQTDLNNLYVSGVGTINNLKGPQGFSVSAGILTVRQDQTALIGVSTGTDKVKIGEANSNIDYQLTFTDALNIGTNYQDMYIDLDNGQLSYNPSTNILTVDRVVGNLSGIATGADNINVDFKNDDVIYNVLFSESQGKAYQRPYIDDHSNHFVYNPSQNSLTGLTEVTSISFTGNLLGNVTGTATNADNVDITVDGANVDYSIYFGSGSGYQRVKSDVELTYNPSTNTLSAGTVNAYLNGLALNADNINVDDKNDNKYYQILFVANQGTDYQRPYIDSNSGQLSYNPGTATFAVDNINGKGDNITNLNGSNISQGLINAARLPDASTTAQGVVQLNDTISSTSVTEAATASAVRTAYLTALELIPAGTQMLFCQGNAPTGWTKVTTHNNKALRVVSGNGGGSGGNNTFTSTFAQRSVVLPRHNHSASSGNQSRNHSHSASTQGGGSHTHSVSDPGHAHSYQYRTNTKEYGNRSNESSGIQDASRSTSRAYTGISISSSGSTHNHGVSVGSNNSSHSHSVSVNYSGTSGAQMDFRVQYVDVIIASKN